MAVGPRLDLILVSLWWRFRMVPTCSEPRQKTDEPLTDDGRRILLTDWATSLMQLMSSDGEYLIGSRTTGISVTDTQLKNYQKDRSMTALTGLSANAEPMHATVRGIPNHSSINR